MNPGMGGHRDTNFILLITADGASFETPQPKVLCRFKGSKGKGSYLLHFQASIRGKQKRAFKREALQERELGMRSLPCHAYTFYR